MNADPKIHTTELSTVSTPRNDMSATSTNVQKSSFTTCSAALQIRMSDSQTDALNVKQTTEEDSPSGTNRKCHCIESERGASNIQNQGGSESESTKSEQELVVCLQSIDLEKEVIAELDPDLAGEVRKALSGKPEEKLIKVFMGLFRAGIDSVDDFRFLAAKLKDMDSLVSWLESETSIPTLSCLRLASYFSQ